MPKRESARRDDARRSAEERAADHAAVERLTADVLPGLVARLAATGLGEVELREDDWRVRLRRPGTVSPAAAPGDARRQDRAGRAQPGHAGHGHAPAAVEGRRAVRISGASTNGATPGQAGDGAGDSDDRTDAGAARAAVATSPAVGIFQPGADVRPGTAVRAGDRLGIVDVLGIPEEIVAPADGIVGASLVEAGHAVEYGQELLRIERTGAGGADRGSS